MSEEDGMQIIKCNQLKENTNIKGADQESLLEESVYLELETRIQMKREKFLAWKAASENAWNCLQMECCVQHTVRRNSLDHRICWWDSGVKRLER